MPQPSGGLSFPDEARTELDRALGDLVRNAQRVLETQGRLRSLLQASQAVVEQLELGAVLHRIVDAAVDLIGARYGALGVIAPEGGLEQFLHVGIPAEVVEEMGELPQGRGLLGALIADPRPVRLDHLGEDPRSAEFPAGHPAMESFLGVPIRIADEVFGNLYLTEHPSGRFSDEDEELLGALAATAGIAIAHARLYEDTRRRQRWSAALASINAALLSMPNEDSLDLLTDSVAALTDSQLVAVLIPAGDDALLVEAASGSAADGVTGLAVRYADDVVGSALRDGEPRRVAHGDPLAGRPLLAGPTMAVPLLGYGRVQGVLTISRSVGRPTFRQADLEMAAEFAGQVGIARELAAARDDQQRLAMLEDRSRIARELHDHVVQRLFASGLTLQGVAGRVHDPASRQRILEEVEALDDAITEIRTAIFALTAEPHRAAPRLRHRILDLLAELAPLFRSPPRVTFSGTLDLSVPEPLAEDVLAAAREGLTNVARHASADEVTVDLAVREGELTLAIGDDGRGMSDPGRVGGLANLRARATRWGGDLALGPRAGGGTVLVWRAGLREARLREEAE